MKVAVMFSGGKDSTYAIDYAMSKGWEISYLLSVKPTRTDCFLFHFATVEHTPILAKMLNIKHHLISCDVADAEKEAALVRDFVLKQPKVDAVILGGTGLQLTQIKSIQKALLPAGIEVFAAHAGLEHDDVMREMLKKGYKFMITQIASDGLGEKDLGLVLTPENIDDFFKRARKYGFHPGGEGGYFDSFVIEAPILPNRIEIQKSHKVIESSNQGHLVIEKLAILPVFSLKNKQNV